MEAVEKFFPNHKNWDILPNRRRQAEDLQILADGPRLNTSLVVFDNGEGQLPEAFKDTFLSLLREQQERNTFRPRTIQYGGCRGGGFLW